MKNFIKYFAIFSLISIFNACTSDPKVENTTFSDEKLTWTYQNAVRINSIDPESGDLNSMGKLENVFGDARVVLLGEQSHGDGATFLAKTKIIKYLHEKMGFNVILFESGIYDCNKADKYLENGQYFPDAISEGVFGIWTKSKQFKSLRNYINQNHSNIEIGGFDCQFTGRASKENFVNDVKELLKKTIGYNNNSEWQAFEDIMQKSAGNFYYKKEAPKNEVQKAFFDFADSLISKLKDYEEKNTNRETRLFIQILQSFKNQAEMTWKYSEFNFDIAKMPREIMSLRDIQMGENLIWLANEYYKNEKIIVWAATFHIARNLPNIELDDDKDFYKNIVTMGDVVWEKMKNDIYVLGFTASEGYSGRVFSNSVKIPEVKKHSLEDIFNRAGLENAIINFKSNNIPDWLKTQNYSMPLGYTYMKGDWTNVMDGIMFTKKMIPSEASMINIQSLYILIPFLLGAGMVLYNRKNKIGCIVACSTMVLFIMGIFPNIFFTLKELKSYEFIIFIIVILFGGIWLLLKSLLNYVYEK